MRWALPRKNRAYDEARRRSDLETLLQPARRPTVFGFAWWWRYELGLIVGLSLGLTLLVWAVGIWWAVATVSAMIGVFGPWPPMRRLFLAAAWRIVTPHRLRVGFTEARILSRNGRIPTVMRTSQEPFGERVRLWCPAGTSVEDFRAAVSILRTACWATDIRVISHERHAQLVTLDVIRDRAQDANWPLHS